MKRRRGPRLSLHVPTDGRRVHMSWGEIAAMLGTTKQNVEQIHARGAAETANETFSGRNGTMTTIPGLSILEKDVEKAEINRTRLVQVNVETIRALLTRCQELEAEAEVARMAAQAK